MSIPLRVSAADRAPTTVNWTGNVYRIGSDPGCDLRLPELPPRALTVFRRAAAVFVLNRCGQSITLGRKAVASGVTVEWPVGEVIASKKHRLKLELLRPSRKAAGTEVTETSASPNRTAERKAPNASPGQLPHKDPKSPVGSLVIIAFSLVAISLMLWLGEDAQSTRPLALNVVTRDLQTLIVDQPDNPLRRSLEHLAHLVSQWDLAIALQQDNDAELWGREATLFCESLVQAEDLSPDERRLASRLNHILTDVP